MSQDGAPACARRPAAATPRRGTFSMPDKARILVVANHTADSDELVEELRERAAREPMGVTLVVPAVPRGLAWAADMYSGAAEAEKRLRSAQERLREAGVDLDDARVGSPDPLAAVCDAIHFGHYDEIVVSTLPRHVSRWLKCALPRRIARVPGVPVSHVVSGRQAPSRFRRRTRVAAPRPLEPVRRAHV